MRFMIKTNLSNERLLLESLPSFKHFRGLQLVFFQLRGSKLAGKNHTGPVPFKICQGTTCSRLGLRFKSGTMLLQTPGFSGELSGCFGWA